MLGRAMGKVGAAICGTERGGRGQRDREKICRLMGRFVVVVAVVVVGGAAAVAAPNLGPSWLGSNLEICSLVLVRRRHTKDRLKLLVSAGPG